ncbi:hypothetical protein BD769DRAFT_1740999 [Suillus cothurnatus]|nr:hypothetical protein BD769DRAFT_1740999 [Suillus cothurnatus]
MTSTNPPAGRTTRTRDQIIAENAAITARNDICVAHCNKGESNVENDEPLIPVPPTPPIIFPNSNTTNTIATLSTSTVPTTTSTQPTPPPPTSNPTGTNVNAMILVLANLSPIKIAKIHASIFNTTSSSLSTATASTSSIITSPSLLTTVPSAPSVTVSSSSNTPTLLFDINNEHTSSTSISDPYGIHTYIVELARCHQHIPLSILTMKIMTHLFLEPSMLKFVTHYTSHRNSAPMKCHILDVSQFPAESSISIGEWHEAWVRFLKLLTDYASPEIHNCKPHTLQIRSPLMKLSTTANLRALKLVSSERHASKRSAKQPQNPTAMNPTPAIPAYTNHPLLTSPFGVCQSQKEIAFPPSASAAEISVTPTPIVPPAPHHRVQHHTQKLSTNNSPVAPPLTLNTVSI